MKNKNNIIHFSDINNYQHDDVDLFINEYSSLINRYASTIEKLKSSKQGKELLKHKILLSIIESK